MSFRYMIVNILSWWFSWLNSVQLDCGIYKRFSYLLFQLNWGRTHGVCTGRIACRRRQNSRYPTGMQQRQPVNVCWLKFYWWKIHVIQLCDSKHLVFVVFMAELCATGLWYRYQAGDWKYKKYQTMYTFVWCMQMCQMWQVFCLYQWLSVCAHIYHIICIHSIIKMIENTSIVILFLFD